MTADVATSATRQGQRWWQILRAVGLALWVVAAAASWWSAPRHASYDEARAAVAQNRLTVYQWGDSWDRQMPHPGFDGATLLSTGTRGPLFVWRTGDGRVRWTDTNTNTNAVADVHQSDTVEERDYSGLGAAGLARDLQAAGMEHRAGVVDTPTSGIPGGAIVAVIFLGVLVAGPAPVLGTRWFWFWLTYTAPYGLGLVFWLVRERPWSRTARPPRIHDRKQQRDRGYLGLLIGLIISFLVSSLTAVLNAAFGDWWVPPSGDLY